MGAECATLAVIAERFAWIYYNEVIAYNEGMQDQEGALFPFLPGYRVQRQLGQGGFGTTYLVEDFAEGQRYVIKRLAFERVKNWKDVELFEREARVLASLRHPRIPAFRDLVVQKQEHDGQPREAIFLIQSFVPGQTLADCIQQGQRFTETEAAQLALQALDILAYLHSLNPPVIHRDIKPENLILTPEGQLFLVDFGAVRDQVRPERGSTIIGTFGYMAPEQFDGRAYPATDIYALGISLIYLLTHTPPEAMEKEHFTLRYRPHGQISHRLSLILDRMIAPLIEQRYATVAEVRQDLDDFLQGHAPRTAQPPAPKKRPFWHRSNRSFWWSTAAVAVLLWGGLQFRRTESSPVQNRRAPATTEDTTQPPTAPEHLTQDSDLPPGLQTARWRGQLRYRGQVLDQFTPEQVRFWFRDEKTGRVASSVTGHYYRGHIWFSELPETRLLINVTINANPDGWAGDFERSQSFNIFPRTPYALDLEMYQVLRLVSPEDTLQGLPHWGSGSDPAALPVWPAPLALQWEPLSTQEAPVTYRYTVERRQYDDGKYTLREVMFEDSTQKHRLDLQLPPSADDEYYLLKLSAHDPSGRIGLLVTHGERGGKSWDYRFRVAS